MVVRPLVAEPGAMHRRTWVRALAILLALTFLGDLWATPGRTLLPVYVEAVLGRGPYITSLIVSVRLLLGGAAAFLGGALSDALGQRRVFLLGLSGVPLVGLLFLVRSPAALLALSVYIGFAGGAYYLGAESYMLGTVPVRLLGTAAALLSGIQTLGGALGGLLAAPIIDNRGFGFFGMLAAGGAVVVLFAGVVFMPRAESTRVAHGARLTLSGYASVMKRRPVLLLAALRFVPTVFYGMATLLMPLLIYRVSGEASAAALYGTATLLFASVTQLATGRLCDRLPYPRITITLTVLLTLAALATPPLTGSLVGLYAIGVLGMGAAWALSVTVPGWVSGISRDGEQGRTLGFIHLSWYAGMITGTQLGGLLVSYGNGVPFVVGGLFNLLAVAAAVALAPYLGAGRQPVTAPAAAAE